MPAWAPSHDPGSLKGVLAVLFPFIALLFYHLYSGCVKALEGNNQEELADIGLLNKSYPIDIPPSGTV